jgi:RHS repeat-associated protein
MKPVTTDDATPVLGGDGWVALPFRIADPVRQNSRQGSHARIPLASEPCVLEPRTRIGLHATGTAECSGSVYRARYYDPVRSRFVSEDPIGFEGGINAYRYVLDSPIGLTDPLGLDETFMDCGTARGRNGRYCADGPRNGNWGGKNWSGGWNPDQHGGQNGPGAPTDSADACYMAHDKCYGTPACSLPNENEKRKSIRACDLQLVRCLQQLPDDSTKWPRPPRKGTENDSQRFRLDAMDWFRW